MVNIGPSFKNLFLTFTLNIDGKHQSKALYKKFPEGVDSDTFETVLCQRFIYSGY